MFDLVKARAFLDSYDDASRSGDPAGLARHYAEPYTSFTLGHVEAFASREQAVERVTPWLARFLAFGLDDIRLVDGSVTPVSDSFGLCNATWEIRPKDGTPPWRWLNVYGLRQDEHGQRFEFAISDNEITNLLQRYPAFMTLS